ncbi:hypothetical protein AAF712_010611 [Marasmius tenuissimus]|uniref:Transmembrane protein n=1 Tax=Marasmius tenuissimus TaxID=585030 RepID=A0ABR2ZP16_9AGAR
MFVLPTTEHRLKESLGQDENAANPLMKRATPQIAGSSGGFIALIVCLVMVIAVSCTAIFFLLRDHEPTDAERAARRQRRYTHQTVPSSSSYMYDPSSTPSKKGLWAKVVGVFDKNTTGSSTSTKNRKKNGKGTDGVAGSAGWIQAGSGDEWDSEMSGDEGEFGPGVGGRPQTRSRGHGMVAIAPSPLSSANPYTHVQGTQSPGIDPPFRPPGARMDTADSISSAYFDSHAITGLGSGGPSPSPYSPTSPVMSPSTASVHGDSSPNISTLPRSNSPEPMSAVRSPTQTRLQEGDTRKWSVQSDVSARTLASGTKFIEAL